MDLKLFLAINRLAGRSWFVDRCMILISQKMRYVYFFILFLLWLKKGRERKMAYDAGISVLICMVSNRLIKLLWFRPRPFLKRRIGILIPSLMDSSFPSKHTILAFAVSTIIFLHHRFLGIILLGLSWLTGFSRIWIGHHYPFDIIGSAFLGTITSVLLHQRREMEGWEE
ncbi:MAG: undecaprenyl-diphosphatase [Bacillota bacterium]